MGLCSLECFCTPFLKMGFYFKFSAYFIPVSLKMQAGKSHLCLENVLCWHSFQAPPAVLLWSVFLNGFVKRRTDDQPHLWSYRTDHCALLISLKLKRLSLSLMFAVCLFVFYFFFPLHPSFYFFLILSSPAPCVNYCHTFSLSPPAGVGLVISGGCWGSSQSCKWGSPPGWPRHTVVQVRKPATLPTKQRWER